MRKLSAGKPFTVNNFTFVPIEETTIYSGSVSKSGFVYASKKPKALIVVDDKTSKAYNMNFDEIPIETLIEETEGLEKLIKM